MSVTATESTQYLTFRLAEETYATDIAQVREVLEYAHVTRVPRMPEYMRGVINLRGHVVPVLDLKLRFGMEQTGQTVNTCIIIVEARLAGETTIIGALADSVQEVIEMDAASIQPPPKIGTRLRADFIRGIGKRDEQFVIVLDIDRVFCAEELEAIAAPPAAAGEPA